MQMNRHQRRWNPIRINWAIKGYHRYRIKSSRDVRLTLIPKANNRYDPNAIGVHVPQVLPPQIATQQWETRAGPREAQTLRGAMVGHVPANLCEAFLTLRTMGVVHGHIRSRVSGQARPSLNPPPVARYQRGRGPGHERAGGGAGQPCRYTLTVERAQLPRVMAVFEQHLPRNVLPRFRV